MVEPEKPFACPLPDCGKTFTNEDHLHVHTKKHDMYLQFGMEQKAGFVADQTPTPTRFIRNCEEVGLFQDLQSVNDTVNPFDEGFQRALETNSEPRPVNLLEGDITTPSSANDDVLHTPQMVFPILDAGDSTLFSRTNNQRNITISRSSSDESGAIKEYETTTISKLTNEVTTISRIVGKQELDKIEEKDLNKDRINETVYRNNVIKIQSNVEIRKDNLVSSNPICYTDTVIKDASLSDPSKLQVPELNIPPIMSQRSLDYVVDSLTSECQSDRDKTKGKDKDRNVKENADDYEVIIKLPNGKHVRMKAVDDITDNKINNVTKEKLKKVLTSKVEKQNLNNPIIQGLRLTTPVVQNVLPITAGTLIPVTIVNPIANTLTIPKIPIQPLQTNSKIDFKCVKRKVGDRKDIVVSDSDSRDECVVVEDASASARKSSVSKDREGLNRRSAASKRYRGRLKESMMKQREENRQLREMNQRLVSEKAVLKLLITEHMKKCPQADELRKLIESANDKLKQT